MLIIPAVDLHQGKCVRLTQGRLDQEIVYSNDPVFIARLW
ncbi:MAG: HisA/HisF-related TIM barrel protein, partial [Endomicrobia bacterium]|nr:HisA/HisF-related TIM barrel protein [Endomicrobiia bacterium]